MKRLDPGAGVRGSAAVVGGSGGMSNRYRAIVEERGLELRHFEHRVPNGTRRILGNVAAVIIMVGIVAHALRDQVKGLVADDAPVVYLRSALRNAVTAREPGRVKLFVSGGSFHTRKFSLRGTRRRPGADAP